MGHAHRFGNSAHDLGYQTDIIAIRLGIQQVKRKDARIEATAR